MLLAYISLHTVTSISETIIPDRNKFWQKQKHFILYFYTFIKIVSTEIAVSLKIHAFQRFFFLSSKCRSQFKINRLITDSWKLKYLKAVATAIPAVVRVLNSYVLLRKCWQSGGNVLCRHTRRMDDR